MEIGLKLWREDEFYEIDHDVQYIMGIYFGILFFMIAFNLLLFVSIKDISYLYYILFIAAFGFFQLIENGYVHEYFWQNASVTKSLAAAGCISSIRSVQRILSMK